jgi:SAM-dependent methyltransferase
MWRTRHFQVSADQAEAYEERFVPALFRQRVEPVLQAATVGPGDRMLDVACGTGVVARTAAERVAPDGRVSGVDLNPAMLAVARWVTPDIDWRQGDATALPFRECAFDVVTCQAAIFFSLTRQLRSARWAGSPARAVEWWCRRSPRCPRNRHTGHGETWSPGTRARTPWRCSEPTGTHGDPEIMSGGCADAGLRVTAVHQHTRPAYFPNIQTMVLTEVTVTW